MAARLLTSNLAVVKIRAFPDFRNARSVIARIIMGWVLTCGNAVLRGEMGAQLGADLPQPLPLFPADNWWNADIRQWPVDPQSDRFIAFINNGSTRRLHPDLGGNAGDLADPNATYGMPYVVVSNVTAADLVAVEFEYGDESDGVDHATGRSIPFYPIPRAAITQPFLIEGGDPGQVDRRSSLDRHLLLVDSDRNYLYELYNVFYDLSRGKWLAGSGAFFDLNANGRRPADWTSADAAGLAILPGLIRYDEVYNAALSEISHAFRVTVRATDGYVYPASHRAGSRSGALPMGARLRLKSSVDVPQRTSDANMQRIFHAMQKHGLIVADNGSDMYITGTYDPRWNNDVINPAFRALSASDFEVVQLGYNPPITARGPVVALGRQETAVQLSWQASTAVTKCQIQMADRLNGPLAWHAVAESTGNSWSQSINKEVPSRFFRLVVP